MSSKPDPVPRTRIDPVLLGQVVGSQPFIRSQRMCRFLTLLVERANQGETPKETEIGVVVFDRSIGYDPKIDSIVRTEATRLRRKLSEYYVGEGRNNPLRLHLPPGRYELEVHPNVQPVPAESVVPPRPRRRLPYMVAATVGLAILGIIVWRFQVSSPRVLTASPLTFFPGTEEQPSFAPDGKRVAYTWDGENNGRPAVYVQALVTETPVRLTQSPAAEHHPVWSPDGTEIAFLRRATSDRMEVRKVRFGKSSAGDASDTLICTLGARANTIPGLSWSPDGALLASAEPWGPEEQMRLILISPITGEKSVFHQSVDQGKISYLYPAFSPDGRSLAYVKSLDTAVSDVYAAAILDGKERQLTFDRALIYGIAWADPRELIVSSARGGIRPSLWRVHQGSAPIQLTQGAEESIYPSVSRDGKTVAFSRHADEVNVWRRSLNKDNRDDGGAPWLASSGLNSSPQFSPDGSKVAFRSNRTGPNEIWIAANNDTNGGRAARCVTHFGGPLTGSPRWSPDGKWIAFDSRASGNSDIWIVAESGGEPRRITPESSNESLPSWSRDGRWIYYNSDRSGRRSMWRRPWSGGDPLLVRENACAGWESPDGQYLYYVHSPNEKGLFRAPLAGGEEETVLPNLSAGMWGNWAFGRKGIYFIDFLDAGARREGWAQLLEPSGEVRALFRVNHPVGWDGSLAVSRDEMWLAYAQVDRSGSDILLLKDWR